MLRIVVGVIAGLLAWLTLWVGGEQILSAIWPRWFGAHQLAFQAAITDGAPFTADPTVLATHVALGTVVSAIAGLLAALIAGENKRAPRALGVLLLIIGLLKAVMSWPLVPLWYHVLFTAILLPMAILGGRLKTTH